MRGKLVLWTIAALTMSCAIVANLGDRTLGDPFSPEDGGGSEGGDGDGGGREDVVSPPFDAPPGCVIENFPAPLLDVQLYLAVDTSASMQTPLPGGGSRFS